MGMNFLAGRLAIEKG